MLSRIQKSLQDLYDVELDEDVDDFVCDEDTARDACGDEVERREVLLVQEDPDGVAVGLYVDQKAIDALKHAEDAWLDGKNFDAACLATEGVSHFVYLMFRAKNDEEVTQLELELQAEVDKYATALLAGNGVGAIAARSRELRRRLFDEIDYLDDASTESGDRYRLATRLAARYALHLEETYVARGDFASLSRALRRFYRMSRQEKLAALGGAH